MQSFPILQICEITTLFLLLGRCSSRRWNSINQMDSEKNICWLRPHRVCNVRKSPRGMWWAKYRRGRQRCEIGYHVTEWHSHNYSGCKPFPVLLGPVDSELAGAGAPDLQPHHALESFSWPSAPATALPLQRHYPHSSAGGCARPRDVGQSCGASAVQGKPALRWHAHSQAQRSLSLLSLVQEWKTRQVLCAAASPPSGLPHCGPTRQMPLHCVLWWVHSQYKLYSYKYTTP